MERIDPHPTRGKVRAALAGSAGPWEVVLVTACVIVVWRAVLGWDWSSGTAASHSPAAQTSSDWLLLAVAVVVIVAWLSLRGRAVSGTVAICLSLTVLSGWRMAAADVLAWPIVLASLVFALSVVAFPVACAGAWARHLLAAARETPRAGQGPSAGGGPLDGSSGTSTGSHPARKRTAAAASHGQRPVSRV